MPDHWHSSLGYRDGRNPVQSDIFQLLRSHAIEPLTLHNGSEAEIQITGNHDNPELVIQLKQEIAALLERHGYPCVILGESSNATCVMPQTVDVTA